jgi:hypothetical protein
MYRESVEKLFAVSFYRYFARANMGNISFSICDSPSPAAPPCCEEEDGCEAEVQQERPTRLVPPPLSNRRQQNQGVKRDVADDENSAQAGAAVLGEAGPTEKGPNLARTNRTMACSREPPRAPGEKTALDQSHSSHYVKPWAVQEFDNDFQDDIGPVVAAVAAAASQPSNP